MPRPMSALIYPIDTSIEIEADSIMARQKDSAKRQNAETGYRQAHFVRQG